MRGKNLKGVLAALLTGAMVLSMPTAALASGYYIPTGTVANPAMPTPVLGVKWEKGDPYLVWNPLAVSESADLCIEYSTDATFQDQKTTSTHTVWDSDVADGKREMSYLNLDPGKTYYIRAMVRDYGAEGGIYGAFSAPVAYTVEVPKASVSQLTTTSTSVNFLFSKADTITGYEVSRKIGSKWKVVGTVADNTYTDKNLKANKTYSYRIRAYVYDEVNKAKVYSTDYKYETATTWGTALKVKASAVNTKKIKVTWKKVTGASGYKIYRAVGEVTGQNYEKGEDPDYTNYKLVKTIKKAKTVSFTDKNLTPGQTYSYKVVAYKNKTKNNAALSVEGYSDGVTLGFNGWTNYRQYTNADGSVTVTWPKIVGAEGFVIERQSVKTVKPVADDDYEYETTEWVEVGRLPGTATSQTFVATEEANWKNTYRISVYCGNKYEEGPWAYPTIRKVSAPGSISAVANADGSIDVSWAAVPNAAYYTVTRSTRLTKAIPDTNSYGSGSGVALKVLDATKPGKLSADGTYYEEDPEYVTKIVGTSVKDTYLGYPYLGWDSATQKNVVKTYDEQEGPKAGVRYYYYVTAYAYNGKVINQTTGEQDTDNNTLYTKPGSAVVTSTTVGKPTIKKVTAGKKKATVTWKKVAGAEKYLVYVSAKKGKGYTLAGVTTKTKLTVTGLTSGKTSYFKVKAVKSNEAGADAYSALSKVKSKKIK